MGSVNQHIIVGTVGKDPIVRTTTNGKSVAEISIATNDGDRDEKGKDVANWHKVVCFGTVADFVGKYVVKGSIVCAMGPCKIRSFQGKENHLIYVKETIGFKVELIAKGKNQDNNYSPAGGGGGSQKQPDPFTPVKEEEDLPF